MECLRRCNELADFVKNDENIGNIIENGLISRNIVGGIEADFVRINQEGISIPNEALHVDVFQIDNTSEDVTKRKSIENTWNRYEDIHVMKSGENIIISKFQKNIDSTTN